MMDILPGVTLLIVGVRQTGSGPDLAEQLLQREGLTYQRRREEGLDIVDTRDPDRTHVLLVWLSHDAVADDRLPPWLYGWE
jgi:hypothetical protein